MKNKIPPGENRFFSRRVPFLIVLLLFSANLFSQITESVIERHEHCFQETKC